MGMEGHVIIHDYRLIDDPYMSAETDSGYLSSVKVQDKTKIY